METAQVLARRSEGAYAKTVETVGFGVFAKTTQKTRVYGVIRRRRYRRGRRDPERPRDRLGQPRRERIMIALAMVDAIDARIAPLERELRQLARRQTGCQALMGLYGWSAAATSAPRASATCWARRTALSGPSERETTQSLSAGEGGGRTPAGLSRQQPPRRDERSALTPRPGT